MSPCEQKGNQLSSGSRLSLAGLFGDEAQLAQPLGWLLEVFKGGITAGDCAIGPRRAPVRLVGTIIGGMEPQQIAGIGVWVRRVRFAV